MNRRKVKDTHKIAVLRANALGDFIVTLPALQALRYTYPDAEIVLLGKPWHREFLQKGRTPVDRVVVVPVCAGIREEEGQQENPCEQELFFEEMRKERFDIALHFHGKGVASNAFLNRLGARVTAGLTSPGAAALDRSVEFYYYQSEAVRYLEVAALVGADPVDLEPRVNVLGSDMLEVQQLTGLSQEKPYVVLHPAANDSRRMWPPEKYISLASGLSSQNYHIVLTGSASERSLSENIASQLGGAAVNTCGELSLGGLAALLAQSRAMVAADTGPLHLARAVGARTVGIYWAPNLLNWGPLTRSNHRPVISWDMHCPECRAIPNDPYPFEPLDKGCEHRHSFVKEVSAAAVLDQVNALLNTVKL
jgi:ADP-heptose:LPS heptosyltransferase